MPTIVQVDPSTSISSPIAKPLSRVIAGVTRSFHHGTSREWCSRATKFSVAAAQCTPDDVDVLELYDPFSVVTLCLLEEYGFAKAGNAGPMALALRQLGEQLDDELVEDLVAFGRAEAEEGDPTAEELAAMRAGGLAEIGFYDRPDTVMVSSVFAEDENAHDVSLEELQSSNEEVQSSNEELQSLNEELETSNEELESTNEELTTSAEELRTMNEELVRARSVAETALVEPIRFNPLYIHSAVGLGKSHLLQAEHSPDGSCDLAIHPRCRRQW